MKTITEIYTTMHSIQYAICSMFLKNSRKITPLRIHQYLNNKNNFLTKNQGHHKSELSHLPCGNAVPTEEERTVCPI